MLPHYGGVWAKITRLGFPGLVAAVEFAERRTVALVNMDWSTAALGQRHTNAESRAGLCKIPRTIWCRVKSALLAGDVQSKVEMLGTNPALRHDVVTESML